MQRNIHKFGSLLLISSSIIMVLMLIPSPPLHAELVDRVMAVVNDDVITLSDVEAEGGSIFQQIIATTPTHEVDNKLEEARERILNTLIDRRLILQKASALNISVTETEVEAAFNSVLQRNNISREGLVKKLEESGINERLYRSGLKSQLLQNKLVGADVRARVVVTDEMVRQHYEQSYTSKVEEGSFYLLQMGFSWKKGAAAGEEATLRQEAKQRAARVHKLAMSGQNFGELARKFSDLPSREDGGDIGGFSKEDMAPYMRDAVVNLKIGEISEVVETPVGFQFFKLLSTGKGELVEKIPYDEVKGEIRQKLYEAELKEAYAEWVRQLKDAAYIQKL